MRQRRRPGLERPERLDGVLSRAAKSHQGRNRPPVSDVDWRKAVGARIADRARPVGLERGILTVRTATSVWASELSLLSSTLIERLREQGIQVTELRFRVGPLDPAPPTVETRTTRRVPTPARLPSELASAIDRIADDELKETIAAAARASLAWQASRDREK
jgi:hypothetical protein